MKLRFFDFKKLFETDEKVIEILKKVVGLKEDAAYEICKKLKIAPEKKGIELSLKEIDKIYLLYEKDFKIEEEVEPEEEVKESKRKRVRRRWYERFYRWFISSDGFLVIMGKNKRHNLTITKKFAKPQNLFLFYDISNPMFAVIVNESNSGIPPQTILEAAQFCAAFSECWKRREEKTEIFYVKGDQVAVIDKSITISGEIRKIEKVKPRIAISVLKIDSEVKIIYGPPLAIRKKSEFFVTLVPGSKNEKLPSLIKKELLQKAPFELKSLIEKVSEDEIRKILPSLEANIIR